MEKRDIFLNRGDYLTFLHLLKTALSPNPKRGSTPFEILNKGQTKNNGYKLGSYQRKNFHGKINLLTYCLMPNHYHLLLQQTEPTAMTELMRSICTSYGMYFNKKYNRVGSLFQGIFKAIDIDDENYLIWVSRYIHRNPDKFSNYPYSSYSDYLRKRKTDWLNTNIISDYFSPSRFRQIPNYQKFVGDQLEEPIDLNFLILEEN